MTDPDADALLRAIVRHAADDTPRLVYADWLEENGRTEEAEFLRVQCRLAAAEPGDPDYPALADRDEELRLWLTAHVPGPRPAFPAGLAVEGGSHWWWRTHRGFPSFLTFDGSERPGARAMRALASAVSRAFDALPTRWLVVSSVTVAQLAALLKQPVLAGLSQLTIQIVDSGEGSDEAARLLAKCRHLRNLRWLRLAFGVTDAACEALTSAHWENLESFAPDCHLVSPAGLRTLAGAGWFRRLRELNLNYDLPDETFAALARLPELKRLHTLNLSHNGFSVESWRAFGETRSLPALAHLQLRDGDLSQGRIESLAGAGGFTLRVLGAGECGAGPDAGAAVAAAPWAGSLRILDLSTNWLLPDDVKAVAACKKFRALRHLHLANSAVDPAGLAALAANPALRELRTLNLGGPQFNSHGLMPGHFDRFLAELDTPDLRHLNLSHRPVGPKAARRLAEPKFESLTRLGLSRCKLTDPAVKALLASPTLGNLIELDLSHNRLATGPEPLADRAVLPRLSACSLAENALPPALARRLRRRAGVRV